MTEKEIVDWCLLAVAKMEADKINRFEAVFLTRPQGTVSANEKYLVLFLTYCLLSESEDRA